MTETLTPGAEADPDAMYGAEYYHSHCGDVPYAQDFPQWLEFYGKIADEIVRSFTPTRVYDAGCAIGFLVAALWDRNVEAHGRDISAYAISQVRADVREYCDVGSIADPVTGTFDLVLCIEVLEHMPEQEAIAAIRTMCATAPRVLFSSTPSDLDEPTHVNVRPTLYWLRQFAAVGFAPAVSYDASYVCPHAMLLERADVTPREDALIAFAEIVRQRIRFASEAGKSAQLAAELSNLRSVMLSEHAARQASEAHWKALLDEAERRTALAIAARAPVRHFVKRVLKLAWWTVTLQLPARLRVRREWRAAQRGDLAGVVDSEPSGEPSATVAASVGRRFVATEPLRVFATPDTELRLSIVTDSIGDGSLFGGVGTALIISALLAEHLHARLRLITRTERANLERIKTVLDAQGLTWNGDIDIVHAPPAGSEDVPVGAGDVFLTTSWWTTRAVLASVPASKVIYLLQEDERLFYARGDEQLRCSETLGQSDLHCLVNSALLYRHFTEGPEPLRELDARAVWFEPAFPKRLFYDNEHRGGSRAGRNLFFYARPNNLRNLVLARPRGHQRRHRGRDPRPRALVVHLRGEGPRPRAAPRWRGPDLAREPELGPVRGRRALGRPGCGPHGHPACQLSPAGPGG